MKTCPQCRNENPSAATFCMYCGIQLDAELPQCPKCKWEHTEVADFCLHCGYAITDKAKKEQKNAEKKILRELKKKIKNLEITLSEEQENKNESEKELQKIITAKETLKNELEKEKNRKSGNQEQSLLLPKWAYIIFSVIVIGYFLILVLVISGVL